MKSNLPYNARNSLSWKGRCLCNPVFKAADILGFWRYPLNLDADRYLKNPSGFYWTVYYMYWLYKSGNPITRSEKGSNLEAYFAEKRRQINIPFLPDGFKGNTSLTISAVGDLMCANGLENSMGKFYAKVAKLIFNVDISIANLESSLTSAKIAGTGWNVNSTREQFDALKGHKDEENYTVFCTANNHILDRGMEGFNFTHDTLEAEGFYYVGTNRRPEAQKKGLIIELNGIKLGLVAATFRVNNRSFPNGKEYNGKEYIVNVIPFHRFQGPVDVSLLEEQISYCRSQDCDFIIASLHWGMEFEFFPRRDQIDIAHRLIEYGADAIISHHTHNIQPFEFYQTRRDPHRRAPIFYGLGNLSSIWSAPYNALSLITNFELVKGYVNDSPKTLVKSVNVTPVLQMEYDCNGKPYLQIENLCDLITSDHNQHATEYLREAEQYADLVLGRNWRN